MIYIGCDHAGFELKNLLISFLKDCGYETEDIGAHSAQSCDYPEIAHKLCYCVSSEDAKGILICGTGIGMSIAANRHSGIRAALCGNELSARLSRRHNNANVLCLGSRITGTELACAIVKAFLETDFEGGRHQRRIGLLTPAL